MRLTMGLALAVILGVASHTQAAPTCKVISPGTTNGTTLAKFEFEMKDLGTKKLALNDWVDKLEVDGKVIPATDYAPNQAGGGTKGDVMITKPAIPAGKHKVKITVVLDDGTKVTGEAEVDFQMVIEPEPLPEPPPPLPPPA